MSKINMNQAGFAAFKLGLDINFEEFRSTPMYVKQLKLISEEQFGITKPY